MTRHIDTREQAVMIRKALRRRYPTTTFSVRIERYAGGSCVNVQWTDGPSERDARTFLVPYDGRRFDGSIDLSYMANSYLLPDGTVTFARTVGHSYDLADAQPKPAGAEEVHFSGSVSTSRRISAEFEDAMAREVAAFLHLDPAALLDRATWQKPVPIRYYPGNEDGTCSGLAFDGSAMHGGHPLHEVVRSMTYHRSC